MNKINYIPFLLLTSLLFFGCTSFSGISKSISSQFVDLPSNQMQGDNVQSATGAALSYFVLGGCVFVLIGIVLCALSMKQIGIVMIAGGGGSALTGYIIEEYAYYAVIVGVFLGLIYAGFYVGNKTGYSLGFENGKDYLK